MPGSARPSIVLTGTIDAMWLRSLRRFAVSAAVLGLAASLTTFGQDSNHRGRKYKTPPPTSKVDVTILRNDDGKPIENASVIFQLVGEKGNMELKTNEDGKTVIDVLPTGSSVVLQVLAKGYQTYGAEYKIDKAQMAIELKLKRPGQQYSIYTDHQQADNAAKGPEKDKTADKDAPAKDAATKDAAPAKDQAAEPAPQSAAKPDAAQPQPQ